MPLPYRPELLPGSVPESQREPLPEVDRVLLEAAGNRTFQRLGAPASVLTHWGDTIYTTDVGQSRPRSFLRFVSERNVDRVYGELADRSTRIFESAEEDEVQAELANRVSRIFEQVDEEDEDFAEFAKAAREGTLGRCLQETFQTVTQVHFHDTHEVPAVPVKVNGVWVRSKTVAKRITFMTPTEKMQRRLHIAFQGLMSDPDNPSFRASTLSAPPPEDPGEGYSLTLRNLSEFNVRWFNLLVSALVTREDRTNGVALPGQKWTLDDLEAAGHTFRPEVRARLIATRERYRSLLPYLTATYPHYADVPELQEEPEWPDRINIADVDALMAIVRRPFNRLINHVRGGRHLNLEQDPDVTARLPIEKGIELRRPLLSREEAQLGPAAAHPLTYWQKNAAKRRDIIKDAGEHKGRTAFKLGGWVVGTIVGFGWTTVVGPAIANAPILWEARGRLYSDLQEYRRLRAQPRLADLAIAQLREDLAETANWQ